MTLSPFTSRLWTGSQDSARPVSYTVLPFADAPVGYLVTALLDKSHLHSVFSGDSWGSDGPAAWRARVVLFLGVALMAGGLAGSLVS